MSCAAKVGKGSTSTPHVNNLPPTTEAFIENVKRAHIQACGWKHALHSAPPLIDSLNNGFIRDTSTKSLRPRSLPEYISLAPDHILCVSLDGFYASPVKITFLIKNLFFSS